MRKKQKGTKLRGVLQRAGCSQPCAAYVCRKAKHGYKRRPSCAQGSFTVEAAALMLIILPVLAAMMIMGFYLHDRAYLDAAASELTAAGSCLTLYDDRETRLNSAVSRRSTGNLTWTKDTSGTVSVSKEQVSASFSGTFSIPGMIAQLMTDGQVSMNAESSYTMLEYADVIRKTRGIKKLADSVRG